MEVDFESQMKCQQIGTKSLSKHKQMALAGLLGRTVVMQTEPLRRFKGQP